MMKTYRSPKSDMIQNRNDCSTFEKMINPIKENNITGLFFKNTQYSKIDQNQVNCTKASLSALEQFDSDRYVGFNFCNL